jgi:hypothetical protein
MPTQRPNPMAGPAYIIALKNALERRTAEYTTPPKTGGTQISTRLDDFLFNHVEALVEECKEMKWNRAEILYALIQRGLFDLYSFLSPEIIDRIVHRIVSKTAPPQPPAKSLEQ